MTIFSLLQRFLQRFFQRFFKAAAPTEVVAREEQAKVLLERHQVLVENLAAALVIRSIDGTLTYCSPYTEVLTGYALPNIYGASEDFFLQIAHPEDRETLTRSLELARVGESFQVRFRFFHHTGIEMCAEARTAPLYDEHGALISSITIVLDVTRAVKQEDQLSERNEDLRNITSVAAEEIQNEVFTIQGMLQLEGSEISKEEMRNGLQSASTKLEQLAQGLTEFGNASRTSGEIRALLLQEVIDEFVEEEQIQGGNIEVLWGDLKEGAAILGNKQEIKEALRALCDYLDSLDGEKDTLQLSLRLKEHESTVQIHLLNGRMPIPTHLQHNIFTTYHSAPANMLLHKRTSRTPFSLSLAKKRVQRLGGTLEHADSSFVMSLKKSQIPTSL